MSIERELRANLDLQVKQTEIQQNIFKQEIAKMELEIAHLNNFERS